MPHSAECHGPRPAGTRTTRRLGLVLGITATYAAAEAIGGWLANSLALLADAGHMLADVMALTLALLAAWFARRPPDPVRTYGYQRVEILAALVNGVSLVVIAAIIISEALERMSRPPEVESGLMAGVAAGGLVVNLVAAGLLHRHQHGLNMRAAYLHVLGDLLGSIGALLAAALIWLFGWLWADPAVSVVIAVIIIVSAVRLLLTSVNVLLEGTPAHLDVRAIRECLEDLEGVSEVHDLHLWSLGGDSPLLSAHLVLDHSLPWASVLRTATASLRERFEVTHATLQLEPVDFNVIENLTSENGTRKKGT